MRITKTIAEEVANRLVEKLDLKLKQIDSEFAEAYIAEQKKSKSLKPEELVDGEIYLSEEGDYKLIFRFKNIVPDKRIGSNASNYYSCLEGFDLYKNSWLVFSDNKRFCRPATLPEKQTLISAEIENGYFHELKNQK